MILYLYLQAKPLHQVSFSSGLVEEILAHGADITAIDLDAHSESFTVSKSLELVQHAEKLILHIETTENELIGSLRPVFEKLRHFDQHILCLQNGEHESIEKMLKLLKIEPVKLEKSASGIEYILDFLAT